MKKLLFIFALLMCMSLTWAQNVAKIGTDEYATIQAAVDAAYTTTGDVTIELLANTEEHVLVQQKAGLNLTIDGQNKTLSGQIVVDGMGRSTGTETLLITNINFTLAADQLTGTWKNATAFVAFVKTNSLDGVTGEPWYSTPNHYNYAHNVTVSNCTMDATGGGETSFVGVQCPKQAVYNITIDNVTISNAHSLAQFTSSVGITITNCTATTNMYHGISVTGGSDHNVVITGNTIDANDDYGIRVKGSGVKHVTLSDNDVEAPNALIFSGNPAGTTIDITSGVYKGDMITDGSSYESSTITDGSDITITGGTYSSDVTPDVPYGYTVVNNGDGTYTVGQLEVARIGSTTYPFLQDALDSAYKMTGDVTIEIISDDINTYSVIREKNGLNLTIEGNDHNFDGQLIINGMGLGESGTGTVTIQNLNFNGDNTNFYTGTDAFIVMPKPANIPSPYNTNTYNYANNVTINNCDFTSTSASLDVVGLKVTSAAGAYNLTMTNCTGDNLHSLAQLTGTTGLTFTNDTITNSESFVNISGGAGTGTISNCSFTSAGTGGYAVRENGGSGAEINLSNNTFTAASVLQLGKNNGSDASGHINVESGTYNGALNNAQSSTGTAAFVFTGGTFSEPKATVDSWCAPGYFAIENDPDADHCTVHRMYALIYNKNEASATGTMDTTYVKQSATDAERTLVVADCDFTWLPDHSFKAWNTKADALGDTLHPGDNITLISDTTLYVIWQEGYTIFYHNNGGTGTIPNQSKAVDETIILSDGTDGAGNYLFTKTDSTLYWWNTAADESGTGYALGAEYSDNANLNLYAAWRLNLNMTMDSTDVVCYGEGNGTDTVKIIGGEMPFKLVLSGTEDRTITNIMTRTYVFENLEPGSYMVTLTDTLNKDIITGTFTIAQPDTLIVETMTVPVKPCPLMGVGEYNVSMTTTGGNGDNHFAWSDAAVNVDAMATTVVPGADDRDSTYTVTVTVTDKKNCTATRSETFTVSPVIADDGTVHSNTKMTIDTVKQGIMQGCDTIIRNFGYPTFTFNNPAITEDILDTVYNNIPTVYPDSIFSIGYNPIIWTAVDTCGHEVTCEQIIYIYHYPCPTNITLDGYTYQSVRVGCTCWLNENLRAENYSDGRPIENVMTYVSDLYPNEAENLSIYGHLYDWYAAADTNTNSIADIEANYALGKHIQGICPDGWSLPNDEEFEELQRENTRDLRSTEHWINGGMPGTNATGFNAVPGGWYNCSTSRFESLGGGSYYWSCHPVYDTATGAMIDYVCEKIQNPTEFTRCSGLSVRCVLVFE